MKPGRHSNFLCGRRWCGPTAKLQRMQQAEPPPWAASGPAVGRAGVGRAAGGDRRVVQAGGPGDLGRHAVLRGICASNARGRKADRGGWARSRLPGIPRRDVRARRRPRDGGAPAAGGMGRPDAGACSNRPGGDAQRRRARADHPGGDVSGPAAVQERHHRGASVCGLPQSGHGWIARCHLCRQNGAVLRGRGLRAVRGARGVLQIAGNPGPDRRHPGGRPPRPAGHVRAPCRDGRVGRGGAGAAGRRFAVRRLPTPTRPRSCSSPRRCSAIT